MAQAAGDGRPRAAGVVVTARSPRSRRRSSRAPGSGTARHPRRRRRGRCGGPGRSRHRRGSGPRDERVDAALARAQLQALGRARRGRSDVAASARIWRLKPHQPLSSHRPWSCRRAPSRDSRWTHVAARGPHRDGHIVGTRGGSRTSSCRSARPGSASAGATSAPRTSRSPRGVAEGEAVGERNLRHRLRVAADDVEVGVPDVERDPVDGAAHDVGARALLVMAVWWAATTEERTGTYIVRGTVNGITLDIGDADLDIIGGGGAVGDQRRRTDRFAFGHPAEAQRVVRGGTLRLRSRCPAALIGSCSSSYRLRVPDNVPVTVRTTSGDVASSGFRGSARVDTTTGDVNFNSWLGFNLQIRADAGDVRAVAACSPSACSCARARAASTRSCRRGLPRRRRERRGPPQRPRRDRRGRCAVPDPGALDDRRRERGERAVTTGPAACDSIDFARRLRHAGEALEYLRSAAARARLRADHRGAGAGAALSAIWIGLPLCSPRSPSARASPRSSAARPTGCSTRTSHRRPPRPSTPARCGGARSPR